VRGGSYLEVTSLSFPYDQLMEQLITITGDETRGNKAVEVSFERLASKREAKLAGGSKKVIFIRSEQPTPSDQDVGELKDAVVIRTKMRTELVMLPRFVQNGISASAGLVCRLTESRLVCKFATMMRLFSSVDERNNVRNFLMCSTEKPCLV